MALNKTQLESVNQSNFPNNNNNYITPALLRGFNTDVITSLQLQDTAATTGSNTFVGNQIVSGNVDITGTLTAYKINTIIESSSVIYSSGSNQLGDALNDTQILSGSVFIVGSGSVNGNRILTTADTSSLTFNTSSLVTTASFNTYTQSTNLRLNSLEQTSQSLNQFTASQIVSNSYFATTGSNTFTGNQSIAKEYHINTNGIYWNDNSVGYNNLEIINSGYGNVDISAINGRVRIVNSPLTLTGSALTSSNDISTSANIYGANLLTSAITASSLITASVSQSTITFTKGNGTQFSITIADVSGSSGNFVTTASFNSYTASQDFLNTTFATTASVNSLSASIYSTDATQSSLINGKLDTSSFTTFSTSVDSRLDLLELSGSGFATTASVNALSASIFQTDATQSNDITNNSSSFATSISASNFNITNNSASVAVTINNLSSSIFQTDATQSNNINSLTSKTGSYATTGSNTFIGNQTINGDISASGNISASSLYATNATIVNLTTIYETSSVIYSSGSNQLGDSLSDVQILSGSVQVVGGLTVNGVSVSTQSVDITALNAFTASQIVSNSYFATTSSVNDLSASLYFTDTTQSNNIASNSSSIGVLQTNVNSLTSQTSSYAISSSVKVVTDSLQNQINTLATTSSVNDLSASIYSTDSTQSNNISSNSSSIGLLQTFSGSQYKNDSSSFDSRIDSLEIASGGFVTTSSFNSYTASQDFKNTTFATTGSNTFIGNQTITGEITASGNIFSSGSISASYLKIVDLIRANSIESNFLSSGNLVISGDITASGNISSSTISGLGNATLFSSSVDSRINAAVSAQPQIQDEGTILGNATSFNFNGAGVTATLSAGTASVTIAGGGGSIYTGSFAITGSNTFVDNQTLSSSKIIFTATGSNNNGLAWNTGGSIYSDQGKLNFLAQDAGLSFAANGTTTQTVEFRNITPTGSVELASNTGQIFIRAAGNSIEITGSSTVIQGVNFTNYSSSVDSRLLATNAYATTGSNAFTGQQTLTDVDRLNQITLDDHSGSLVLYGKGFTSSSLAHVTATSTGVGNIIFKTNNNTSTTIVSGSNNLFVNAGTPTTGFTRYIGGSGNIMLNQSNVPQISSSMTISPTMNNNYFGGNSTTLTMRGPISSSAWTISANNVLGTINVGSSATFHADKLTAGLTMTGNTIAGTLNIQAYQTALTGSTTSFTNNYIGGQTTLNLSSSAATLAANIINDSGFTLTNQYYSSSLGLGTVAMNRNNIGGQSNAITISGSLPVGGAQSNSISDNFIFGGNNTIYIDVQNARLSGSAVYKNAIRNGLLGNQLVVSGSSLLADLSSFGSVFVGRWNADDSRRNKTSDVVFAVGTGNTAVRKTGFLIDSGSNTFVEGTFNVSGSSTFTGSVSVASTFQLQLPSGSNQQTGLATLDGGNPGTVTVSNSLVTANSIIMLTKQTNNHPNSGPVNVSSKGSGTFTITSNHNGDTDIVAFMIINPS